jgi:hypothetical protein
MLILSRGVPLAGRRDAGIGGEFCISCLGRLSDRAGREGPVAE